MSEEEFDKLYELKQRRINSFEKNIPIENARTQKFNNGGDVGDNKFTYMMLSRLKMDNDYFLGYGNRNEKRLWAGNVDAQIYEMKSLWNSLPENAKPEWLSMEEILDYEAKMKNN